MYSLVNVPTLVRDLARHQDAAAVADELLLALALDEAGLAVLDELFVDAAAQARRRTRVLTAPPLTAADAGGPLDLLERVTLGSLTDLRTFVRRDVLVDAWSGDADLSVARYPQALDVVADGVVGAAAGDAVLAGPWRVAAADLDLQPVPAPAPLLVAAVRSLSPTAPVPPAPAEWAQRMHDACWAIQLTGRERTALAAQLHALRALLRVTGPRPPLRTVAMVVAATHATVVADVLDSETWSAMTQPLFRLVA